MPRYLIAHPSTIYTTVDAPTPDDARALATQPHQPWAPSDPPPIDPNELQIDELTSERRHVVERTRTERVLVWADTPEEAILMAQHFDQPTWNEHATLIQSNWRATEAST